MGEINWEGGTSNSFSPPFVKYGENVFREKINSMMEAGKRRLTVNINQLRNFNRDYAEG